jgi:hypothetical protein
MVEERKSDIIVIFLVTVVGYFIFICGNLFFILSLGIDISLLKMAWINGLTGISQLIPLGFFSFGGKDITYWFFLKELGISLNQIGAFILVINAGYVFNAMIGGIWEIINVIKNRVTKIIRETSL